MKNRSKLFMLLFATVLVSAMLLAGCSDKKAEPAPKKVSVASTEKLPKLVDFWSPTCPPCRAMTPLLHELQEEYDHAFALVKIDVSQQENQTAAYKNQIQYIPTQIFYDENGKQLFRHTGFYSKEDILNKWKELGYDMSPKK